MSPWWRGDPSDGIGSANGALNTTAVSASLGKDPGAALREWNGIIDECRISNSVRSADWIATEYNNQNSPSTFYSYGGENVYTQSTTISAVKVRGGVKFR